MHYRLVQILFWVIILTLFVHCNFSRCGSSTRQESTPTPSCSSLITSAPWLRLYSPRSERRRETSKDSVANINTYTEFQAYIISAVLLCSCFSLTPDIAWVQEAEVCVISSVIPSSAASPGKLSAVNRCSPPLWMGR